MKKLAFLLVLIAVVAASCTPEATEQELKTMCDNLVKLRGKVTVTSLDEATAEVEKVFAKRAKSNKRAAELEVEDWDAELQAKLKELQAAMEAEGVEEEEKPTAEDIQKLKDKFAAKKTMTQERYAKLAKELGPQKELALKATAEKVIKAEADFAKAVDECVAEAQKESISQPLAQCRAKATSTDEYFNKCR